MQATGALDVFPAEIVDNILREVVQGSKVSIVIIPFVCQQWRKRRNFWLEGLPGTLKKPTPEQLIEDAAARGELRLLKWLKEAGCPFDDFGQAAPRAADGGHLEVLHWLRGEGSYLVL